MAVFMTMGIILLVVTLLLFGFIFFWYKLGIAVSPKDEDSPVQKRDDCYLHTGKEANLLCADCGNSMCEECNSEITEVWKTSTESGNTRTTTTHTRTATVCTLCDLAAKEFMMAKAKRAMMIGGIAILISGLVGVALWIATGTIGYVALIIIGGLVMLFVQKRKNVYKGRSRTGGKDLASLNQIIAGANLPEKELEIAKNLQEIGFFMDRFNNFPSGRAIMFFGAIWGAMNVLFWALDAFLLDGEMFETAWIAIMFMAIMAIPAAIIVPAYLGYMPKAVAMRLKINKVRKHLGMNEIEYKAAMFSKDGKEDVAPEAKKETDDEPTEETEALLDDLIEEEYGEEAAKEMKEALADDDEEESDDEKGIAAEADEDPEICIYCGSMEKIHKGHLIAPSKGGAKTVSACEKCNTSKGKKALMDWLRWVKENREERWELIVEHNKGKRTRVARKINKVRDEVPGDECIYCGSTENVQEGHIIAPSKGGQKPVSACEKCNTSKGKKALMDWLRWVKENREEQWEQMVKANEGKRSEVAQKIHKIRDE